MLGKIRDVDEYNARVRAFLRASFAMRLECWHYFSAIIFAIWAIFVFKVSLFWMLDGNFLSPAVMLTSFVSLAWLILFNVVWHRWYGFVSDEVALACRLSLAHELLEELPSPRPWFVPRRLFQLAVAHGVEGLGAIRFYVSTFLAVFTNTLWSLFVSLSFFPAGAVISIPGLIYQSSIFAYTRRSPVWRFLGTGDTSNLYRFSDELT